MQTCIRESVHRCIHASFACPPARLPSCLPAFLPSCLPASPAPATHPRSPPSLRTLRHTAPRPRHVPVLPLSPPFPLPPTLAVALAPSTMPPPPRLDPPPPLGSARTRPAVGLKGARSGHCSPAPSGVCTLGRRYRRRCGGCPRMASERPALQSERAALSPSVFLFFRESVVFVRAHVFLTAKLASSVFRVSGYGRNDEALMKC